MIKPFVRFAPSPTGLLHVGNLRTALVNYLLARQQGGKFLLRIDDTDDERSTTEYETCIREDLNWMGITWDSEARQSSRLQRYQEALNKLVEDGRAYKCFETPEELALKRRAQLTSGRPPVYDRAALKLTPEDITAKEAEGLKPHYRFKLDDTVVQWDDLVRGRVAIPMSSLSDPVILRADGRVIYTLASVVDDIDYGITHILRGEDHTVNTAAQIQLFQSLGGKVPTMGHFALLADADGGGLSKRLGALSIASLRDDGIEAMAIASLLGRIGTADAMKVEQDLEALIASFDIGRFGRATPRFDPAELMQINGRVLGAMDYEAVASRLEVFGGDADFWYAVRGNVSTLKDAKMWYDMINMPITPIINDAAVLDAAFKMFPESEINETTWKHWTKAIMKETGLKGRAVFKPLRLALTGLDAGPELAGLLPLLGRERILSRLKGEGA